MRARLLLVALLWPVVAAAAPATPPLACRPPHSAVDRAICESSELLAMDREIAALYDRGRALTDPATRARMVRRRGLFLLARENCGWAAHDSAHPGTAVDECIRAAMDARLAALRRFVDAGGR